MENSRLSQRELLARIFGYPDRETEDEPMEVEECLSDSGSDHEMDEYHKGMIS